MKRPLTSKADTERASRRQRWDGSLRSFRVPYPGLDSTLGVIQQMVLQWRGDQTLRDYALKATSTVRDKHDTGQMARALYRWISGNIEFIKDQFGIERLQSPDVTIQLGSGDCDDHAILSAAMLLSIGIPARLRVVALNPNQPDVFNHIFTEYFDGRAWKSFDTTLKAFAGYPIPESLFSNQKIVEFNGAPDSLGVLKKKAATVPVWKAALEISIQAEVMA